MRSTLLCFYLLLLFVLPSSLCQRQSYKALTNDDKGEQNKMGFDVLTRFGVMDTQLLTSRRLESRGVRITRPGSSTPKRVMQGSRIALSLDVPTTILSVLIDMARERDMRAKAAANAEIMARIGKRK